MLSKLKLEWKLLFKKVAKLRTSTQYLKLQESILKKLLELLEDQLLVWTYKNSNNLEGNSTQALPTRAEEEVDQIKGDIKLNGQLDQAKEIEINLKMTTYTVDIVN